MSDKVCKHAFKQLNFPPNLIREMELFAVAYIYSGFCLFCHVTQILNLFVNFN